MTESQNIVGLYDILQEVQKRPTLYLSRASIFDLLSFYSGYSTARRSLKLPMSKQEQDFQEFTQWLQNKFEIKANRSWAMII